MKWHTHTLKVSTHGQGLYEFTHLVEDELRNLNMEDGICHLFVQHTSASLCISENADPTAKQDLEVFLNKLAPENQSWHRHTLEGSDDSPSHMKSVITSTSQNIPITNGALDLGTWQGLYLWEHRKMSHTRCIVIKVMYS